MSMMNSGRLRRGRITDSSCALVRIGAAAPVAEMTMSASASSFVSSFHGAADAPPIASAVRAAFAIVRLTIVTCCTPCDFIWRAVSLPISPAPMTSTLRPFRSPKILRASEAAAKLIDTAPAPSAVSVRTRLPTANDEWNRRLSSAPDACATAAALCASFTWPRI